MTDNVLKIKGFFNEIRQTSNYGTVIEWKRRV